MTNRMTAEALRAFQENEGQIGTPRQDREGPVHKAILEFARIVAEPDAVVHHSPNEVDMSGPLAARMAQKASAMGTVKGWPDIEIIWKGRAYFLEIKAPGGRLSEAQAEVHSQLTKAGAQVVVVTSMREAEIAFRDWGIYGRNPR